MDQQEYERSMLQIIVAGVLVAIAEFLVMAFVVNKADIVGFQNALISAGGVMVVVVVVLWIATSVLRPEAEPDSGTEGGQSSSTPSDTGQS